MTVIDSTFAGGVTGAGAGADGFGVVGHDFQNGAGLERVEPRLTQQADGVALRPRQTMCREQLVLKLSAKSFPVTTKIERLDAAGVAARGALPRQLSAQAQRLERSALRLSAVDPRQVLQRGYALLTRPDGTVLARAAQAQPGQPAQALLADGRLDVTIDRTTLD